MQVKPLTLDLSVSPQIAASDVDRLASQGFKSIICNRPDGEGVGQPSFAEIAKVAAASGLEARYLPVTPGKFSDEDADRFREALSELPKPIVAYCRSGTRSATLWSLAEASRRTPHDIVERAKSAGYDVADVIGYKGASQDAPALRPAASHDIVIVGGGAAGAAVAASLLRRRRDLDIAIIEPSERHYYQPGWTMVGGGIFKAVDTEKQMGAVLPRRVTWIKAAVTGFEPDINSVIIDAGRTVRYNHLVVCPGIKLNWAGIEGLNGTLGKNGVTSNYRYDLAPYTWELVRSLKAGRALFTQPPMHLSADHWLRENVLSNIDIQFYNAGNVLFGVPDYVPALMGYVKRYHVGLNFSHNLVAIDGSSKTAYFKKTLSDGTSTTVEDRFDMIHVTPPQQAPDVVRDSPLADAGGWIDVDPGTLRHKRYSNIFGLGDATNTPNAKTAAAARKQAPVVAENLLFDKSLRSSQCVYDGYGSCPLTVERGKIVLAEFIYGGKVAPSFPSFVIDGTKPSRAAWILKERILPPIYWKAMLKGREWMAKPSAMA
jgi:sulfide:quinone oxidoreductase